MDYNERNCETRDGAEARQKMAGEEGFEPSNAGIKIRCLNQLGDSPAENVRAGPFHTGHSGDHANESPASESPAAES